MSFVLWVCVHVCGLGREGASNGLNFYSEHGRGDV